jgi:hypothetical protein
MKMQIPAGKLLGVSDHEGRLMAACLKWHKLEMASDGSVFGEFSVMEGTNDANQINALIANKAAIGFSTSSYASCHIPSPEEREKYGLKEDDYAVVMDDVELASIDPVHSPSVIDAWMKEQLEAVAESARFKIKATESTAPAAQTEDETNMKTLDDLKAKYPEVFALHEAAVTQARTEGETAVKADLAKAVQDALTAKGIDVTREVTEAQAAERLTAAQAALEAEKAAHVAALEAIEAEKAALAAERDALQAKADEAEKAAAETARKDAVAAEADKALKGNRYAESIKPMIVSAAEKDQAFTAESVKALVDSKVAEYEAVFGKLPVSEGQNLDFGIRGDVNAGEGDEPEAGEASEAAKALAKEMFGGGE